MNIKHRVSGHNFHGCYSVAFVGPAEGFTLSQGQAKRFGDALCGVSDCRCGGGYGNGPDTGSAAVEWADYDKLRLIPAELES